MLGEELKALKKKIENKENLEVNTEKLLKELEELDSLPLTESLSLSTSVCPVCGKKIK